MKKTTVISFLVGFIFAIGLGVSGMTQPQKVIGFLDFFGRWDPSLFFVMFGAVAVHVVTYRLIKKRGHPVLETKWHFQERNDITWRLVLGSALFGIGWGIGGFCPGPSIVSLASMTIEPLLFVAMMFIGMFFYNKSEKLMGLFS